MVKISNYNKLFDTELFNYHLCNEEDYDNLCKYNENKDYRINYSNFFKRHVFIGYL